jgi:hypothetical protein
MNYKVIYELELGTIQYQILIIPIAIIFFGLLWARLIKKYGFKSPLEFLGIKPLINPVLANRLGGKIIAGFGFIVLVALLIKIPIEIIDKKEIKNALTNGEIRVIEGKINNYYSSDKTHSDFESWEIDGIEFKNSDYDDSYGYHQSSKLNEIIKGNNQYLRISYYNLKDENIILKIEELIDY